MAEITSPGPALDDADTGNDTMQSNAGSPTARTLSPHPTDPDGAAQSPGSGEMTNKPRSTKKKRKKKKKKKNVGASSGRSSEPSPPFLGSHEGETLDSLRHGKGILRFANGDFYEGSFKQGYRDGMGRYTLEKGKRIYSGEWKRSLRHGKGTEIFPDGSRYEGMYAKDRFEGVGKLEKSNTVYEGEFKQGRKHGHGKMTWLTSKATYEGGFCDGFFHGHGCYIAGSGDIYEVSPSLCKIWQLAGFLLKCILLLFPLSYCICWPYTYCTKVHLTSPSLLKLQYFNLFA